MYGPPQTRTWDFDDIFTTVPENPTTTKKPRKTTTTTTTVQTTTTKSLIDFDPSVTGIQLMYGPPEYFGLDPVTYEPIDPKE